MSNERLNITIASLLHEYRVEDILHQLEQWHLNLAKHAPKAQALKLRWNAAQLQCVANDLWATTIPGIYDETEPSFN